MVYASWPGLSNRPARGTLIACSGSGGCGGLVQGKARGGLVAKHGMRSRGAVIGDAWFFPANGTTTGRSVSRN